MFYTNRALSYLMLRQWTKVVDDCRKALEIDDSLVKGHFYLGQAQCELKRFDEAVDSLRMGELIMMCTGDICMTDVFEWCVHVH